MNELSKTTPNVSFTGQPNARLTILQTVCYQAPGREPAVVETKFNRQLGRETQLYERWLTAIEEWTPLDKGWLDNVSFLTLTNEEGKRRQVVPSNAERQQTDGKVIEIAIGDASAEPMPFAVVRPGWTIQLEPANLEAYRVRCRAGDARFTLTLFPA